ncbi:MAG: flagellar protein FlaG [Lachnospirales bacterium]
MKMELNSINRSVTQKENYVARDNAAKAMEVKKNIENKTQKIIESSNTQKNDNNDTFSKNELDGAIEEANKKLASHNRELKYSVHEGTNRLLIKMVNSETDEVILEIPREEAMDNLEKILEMTGVIVDEKG